MQAPLNWGTLHAKTLCCTARLTMQTSGVIFLVLLLPCSFYQLLSVIVLLHVDCAYKPALLLTLTFLQTGDCLSGIVVKLVHSNGTSENMLFGSNFTRYYTTDGQIVGFHGIAGEDCIKRLGVYTQMNGSELKGEHVG